MKSCPDTEMSVCKKTGKVDGKPAAECMCDQKSYGGTPVSQRSFRNQNKHRSRGNDSAVDILTIVSQEEVSEERTKKSHHERFCY